jgi:hypothetical protein
VFFTADELFIATRRDRTQRAELSEAASPRERMPKGLAARQRLQRRLRTKRHRTIRARRGAFVEPVLGQMKHRQALDRSACAASARARGAWRVRAAVQTPLTLHRECVRRRAAGGRRGEKQENRAPHANGRAASGRPMCRGRSNPPRRAPWATVSLETARKRC